MSIEFQKMFSLQVELLFCHEPSFVTGALNFFVKTFLFILFRNLASLRMVPICSKKEMQHKTEGTEQLQPIFGCMFRLQGLHANHV